MIKIKKQSKPIAKLKKGDKIKVDGHTLEVDDHYVFIKHKDTTEMILELFNPKTEKEYQLRYFDDQVESSLEFYYLQNEFQYVKAESIKEIEW
jgi:NhaP-type Na+/H+ and K+/H+ antiporter